jgi:hypothetical protein
MYHIRATKGKQRIGWLPGGAADAHLDNHSLSDC